MTRPHLSITLARLALVTVGLLCLGIGALVAAGHAPFIRARVLRWTEAELTRRIGCEVQAGAVAIQPLAGRLELRQVRMARGPRAADGTLLQIDAVRLAWAWTGLLHGSLELPKVLLVRPQLTLSAAPGTSAGTASCLSTWLSAAPHERAVTIRRLDIEDGRGAWGSPAAPGSVEGVRGVLEWGSDAAAPLVANLRASRVAFASAGAVRELTQAELRAESTPTLISVSTAEGFWAGARIAAKGRITDPAGAAEVDLELTISAPLADLLKSLGASSSLDGHIAVEGALRGPWAQVGFHGKGRLELPGARQSAQLVFDLGYAGGQLEAETAPVGPPSTFWSHLTLMPATGAFHARARLRDAELDALAGFPALVAHVTGFAMPKTVGGAVTADLDFTGRGGDPATFRGYGTVRVENLHVEAGLPTGRLEARVEATPSRLALQMFSLDLPGGAVRGTGSMTFPDGQLDLPIQANIQNVAALGRGFGVPALGGQMAVAGRVTGVRDAPRFTGTMTWRAPRIALYGLDRIEGDIELARRMLKASRLTVRLGQTAAIVQGTVTAPGTAPLRQLDFKKDLVLDVRGDVTGSRSDDVAAFLPSYFGVRGAFRASGRVAGTPEALNGDIDLTLTRAQIAGDAWPQAEAHIRVTPSGTEIGRIVMQRDGEQVRGELRVGSDHTLSGRLSATGIDLARVSFLADSQLAGRADIQVNLSGAVSELRISGRGVVPALQFRGIPAGPTDATFSSSRQVIDVDLALQDGSRRLTLHFGPPPDRSLRLEIALVDADLDPLLRAADLESLRVFQARATGRVVLQGPASNLAASAGKAAFSAIRLRFGGHVWESQGPTEFNWQGRTTTLTPLRLRSAEWTAELRGTVGGANGSGLHLTARLPFAGLPGFPSAVRPLAGSVTADVDLDGGIDAPNIRGRLEIGNGRLMVSGIRAPFEDVRSVVILDGDRTTIQDFDGRLAGGTFHGKGDVIRHGPDWDLRLAFQEENGNAEALLMAAGPGRVGATGTLSLGGTLASRGRDDADFWRHLEGNVALAMHDGHIGRQTMLARLLALLNMAQLLDPSSIDLFATGMPYKRLQANITVEEGVAKTQDFVLDSRAARMSAVGQANLAEETVEMDVAVKPFQTLDSLVSRIPLAGWLLGGQEKSLVVAYYTVRGPIRDPKVTPRPLASVSRNIFGIFRRLLEIPEAVTGPFEDLPPQPSKPERREGQ